MTRLRTSFGSAVLALAFSSVPSTAGTVEWSLVQNNTDHAWVLEDTDAVTTLGEAQVKLLSAQPQRNALTEQETVPAITGFAKGKVVMRPSDGVFVLTNPGDTITLPPRSSCALRMVTGKTGTFAIHLQLRVDGNAGTPYSVDLHVKSVGTPITVDAISDRSGVIEVKPDKVGSLTEAFITLGK
jgi:hypothetical protein